MNLGLDDEVYPSLVIWAKYVRMLTKTPALEGGGLYLHYWIDSTEILSYIKIIQGNTICLFKDFYDLS